MASREVLERIAQARIAEYALCRNNLNKFVRGAWDILEPHTPLRWNWHHELICEHLQATTTGEIKRLLINVCPRSTKSIITTVSFAPWVWTREAYRRFLFGSYADSLATKHSIHRRNVIESDWYKAGYGDRFKLSPDVNTKSEFANDKTGQMRASGINAIPTGEGGDYVIIDDPHNPSGAESDAERERAVQNFELGWSGRLNNKKTGVIIVIMQRLHQRDLAGEILSKEYGYTHLKLKTIADEPEKHIFPVSKRVKARESGEYLHPERDGPDQIAQARKELGAYGFEGQHQQSPVQRGGNLFKESMFEYCEPPEADSDGQRYDYTWITADTAYKDGKKNDYNVFTVFGSKGDDLWVHDCLRVKMKSSESESIVIPFITKHKQWGFRGAYIEPKGHGIFLNQALPKKGVPMPTEEDVKKFFSDRTHDKEQRANAAIPHLSNRKVKINSAINDKEQLVSECLAFPNGANDDFLDTLVDGVKYKYARTPSILDVL